MNNIKYLYPKAPLLNINNLPFKKLASGKVREIFDLGDTYLMVATDRISAFDVVFNEGIPGKGILLTKISLFWFQQLEAITPHHLIDNHEKRCEELEKEYPQLLGRIMIVKKLKPLSIEVILRGYLAGSAWKDYQENQSVLGYELTNNLLENSQLDSPIFTPTTKAQTGHDIPISISKAKDLIGIDILNIIQKKGLEIFNFASDLLNKNGLILADTKFEFGIDDHRNVYLIDEVLTPDSSRYWFKKSYISGQQQDPLDKQLIRDYLEGLDWNKKHPAPKLPDKVLTETIKRYETAYNLITSI